VDRNTEATIEVLIKVVADSSMLMAGLNRGERPPQALRRLAKLFTDAADTIESYANDLQQDGL
jgi:hypothetical protein